MADPKAGIQVMKGIAIILKTSFKLKQDQTHPSALEILDMNKSKKLSPGQDLESKRTLLGEPNSFTYKS